MTKYAPANREYSFKQQKHKIFVIFVLLLALLASLNIFYTNYTNTLRLVNYDKIMQKLKTIKDEQGINALTKINSNFLAWISIEDLEIELPIVKTSNKDEENYYLSHDFEHYSNKLGSPYQKHNTQIGQSTNTVFVGHSAFNSTMFDQTYTSNLFGKLYYYAYSNLGYSYTIKVQTLTDNFTYKVLSVLKFHNEDTTCDEYSVFNTKNIESQSQFDSFYSTLKTKTLMEFDETAQFGDKFLSLLTCSTENRYDRILVVAKQI